MITNENAQKLFNFLKSPVSNEIGLNFKATIAFEKNIRRLEAYSKSLQAIQENARKYPDSLREMENRKLVELDEYLVKGEDGKPLVKPDGSIDIKKDEESLTNFRKIVEKYNMEYQEDIQKYNAKITEWLKFYKEGEAEVKIEMVSLDDIDFPKNKKLNRGELAGLFVMLEMDDEEEDDKEEEKAEDSPVTE